MYKLIGPVLVNQDPVEAKSNVEKRLEFIGGELKRLDSQLGGLQEKQARAQQQVRLPRQRLHGRICTTRLGEAGHPVEAGRVGSAWAEARELARRRQGCKKLACSLKGFRSAQYAAWTLVGPAW